MIIKYTLPHISIEGKYKVRQSLEMLTLNCNSTRLAGIDRDGVMAVYDLESEGKLIGDEKKDIWAVLWSTDNPLLMAFMEKNRLYVMRDTAKEEPVLSGAYLCEFSDLEIKVLYRLNIN